MKDPCFPGTLPSVPVSQFTATMSGFLTVFITTGNVLIISAIIKDPRKQLRTPFAYFLVNLALSDLIVGVIAMPVSVMYHIMEANRSTNTTSIYVVHIIFFISLAASLFSMAAMCLDRYWTLASLSKSKRRFTRRRCLAISAVIWLLSVAFTCLYFITGFIKLATVYLHISFVCIFGITLLTYVKIMRTLKAISIALHGKSKEDTVNSDNINQIRRWQYKDNCNGDQSVTNTTPERSTVDLETKTRNDGRVNGGRGRAEKSIYKQKKEIAREKRITSVFLTILLTFLSSHLPAIVSTYILQFYLTWECDVRHILRDIVFLLIPIASGLNALICILKLPSVRIAVKETFLCKRRNIHIFSSTDIGENVKSRSPRQWYTQRNMHSPNVRESTISKNLEVQNKHRLYHGPVQDPKYNASCDSSLVMGLKNPSYTVESIQDQEELGSTITTVCDYNKASTRTRSKSFPGCIPTIFHKKKTMHGLVVMLDTRCEPARKPCHISIVYNKSRPRLSTDFLV